MNQGQPFSETPEQDAEGRQARLWQALLPVAALIFFLALNIKLYGGEPHISLVLGTVVAAIVGISLGYSWKSIEEGMVNGIVIALKAVLILLIIGILIGVWIASGVVPLMIYYGLKLLTPEIFLIAACLICSVVSLATGSSWTTAGTVGVALIGVGQGLGLHLGMVAGAIISGAYFGDKMSPLSDTTNLAPAVAGSELFDHIRHMTYTTVPGLVIALVLYAVLGLTVSSKGESSSGEIALILDTLESGFNLSPLLFLPPLLVFVMVIYRIPALPALLGGAALGGILGMVFQGMTLGGVFSVAKDGYAAATGVSDVDALLSRGGMIGMMNTIALILCAMSFGGVMEKTGMLMVLANAILKMAKSTGSLVASTVATCVAMNIIAPDQYLSIVVPGRMYRDAFEKANLHPKNLSRCLEDAGTLTSPLVAWNTCGVYMFGALGVSPFVYLPFAFLNLTTPLISIFYGYTGWTMAPLESKSRLTPKAEAQSVLS